MQARRDKPGQDVHRKDPGQSPVHEIPATDGSGGDRVIIRVGQYDAAQDKEKTNRPTNSPHGGSGYGRHRTKVKQHHGHGGDKARAGETGKTVWIPLTVLRPAGRHFG